jgi:hypothetical protein
MGVQPASLAAAAVGLQQWVCSSGSALLSPPAPPPAAAAVDGQVVHGLPSLVIFGHACLHWAKELQQQTHLLLQQ